ncbi:MAG: hypothetical protein HYU36_10530 [Planctomycetes bacterium]|nr:hypothetical protein [Planctomycetota bacterium]
MSNHREAVTRFVAAAGARMEIARQTESLCRGLLQGALLGLLYLAAARVAGVPRFPWSFLAAAFPAAAAILAVGRSVRTRLAESGAAQLADQRLHMRDQLSGAYHFITARRGGPLVELVIRQAAGRIGRAGALEQAAPLRLPRPLGLFLLAALAGVALHLWLFPPPERTRLSEATRRELLQGRESFDGLLALESELVEEEQKKEFERIRKLIEELNLMSEDATKEEILARLSREISDLDAKAGKDDAMSRALEELKKYRERVALGDLMDEVQKELDKGAEELAALDEGGRKVQAEAIQTLSLVDREALAEKRAKQEALAKELKTVAKTQREKEEAGVKTWDLAEKKPKAGEGARKELKSGPLTYDALREAVENRDIRAMILDAAADRSRASDSYHEVYQNYQRIFESVLYQQRVPSGQEMYARRYFRIIRPEAPTALKK